jgi:hypothetical protein
MIKSLEEFKIYNLSLGLSDEIWKDVLKWNHFDKDTIGKQLVRSADSISANLSEDWGVFIPRNLLISVIAQGVLCSKPKHG